MSITKDTFKNDFERRFQEMYCKELKEGTNLEKYEALGSVIRGYLTKDWINTRKEYEKNSNKQVYYFSMEFLLGRLLGNSLLNLGIRDICKEALKELDINLDLLENTEEDQGLGNGGLGRLAACFLDSMASLEIPGHGMGIRYKHGFFNQKIINGKQVEVSDDWLQSKNVWEVKREDFSQIVRFGGEVRCEALNGRLKFTNLNCEEIKAVPYDTPVIGYENKVVNTLRLWSAEPTCDEFNFSAFNRGDYYEANRYKNSVEAISSILYPEDSFYEGKVLRLKQEYFLVSAGIQSILKEFKESGENIYNLDKKIAIHINDTHPTLIIPELMRILMDEEELEWDEAFRITKNIVSYTNHTILAEALEKWPVEMVRGLIPRVYMIIEEINKRYLDHLCETYKNEFNKFYEMSIIKDGYIRMAYLAVVGSHSVNGVAKLHTEILKNREMADLYKIYPEKFNNKTNGITHRRWLIKSNPSLVSLLKETIGEGFIKNPLELKKFSNFLDDKEVLNSLYNIKLNNKKILAKEIYDITGIEVDINSIFDVQVKRIHGYKRQLLNCLRIMDLYNKILENPNLDIVKRTFIFGGKAAPGYYLAKKIIELINSVGNKINNDPRVKDKIKVVFLENYRVSLAEKIIPATDLSEQISTASKEASGTSNMKFMMNGAITIATLDGANIEIKDEVTEKNIIIFGLTSKEVLDYCKNGGYNSKSICNSDERLKRVLDDLINGKYSSDVNKFKDIYDSLLTYNDEFFLLKDFNSYLKAQEKVDVLYRDSKNWQKICGMNIAFSGIFSSDRTILEYDKDIWKTKVLYK